MVSGIEIKNPRGEISGQIDDFSLFTFVQNVDTRSIITYGKVSVLHINEDGHLWVTPFAHGQDVRFQLKSIIYTAQDWCIIYD